MKLEEDYKLDFCDVLLKPKRSELHSRNDVDLTRQISFKYGKYTYNGIPIIASNMDTIGTFEMYKSLSKYKIMTCFHKYYTLEDYLQHKDILDPNYYMISIGISDTDFENLKILVEQLDPHFVCIDVPNGYSVKFLDFCKKVRQEFPDIVLMGGNIVTNEMTEDLIRNIGLDVVKIGIGSGAQCLTRRKTGVGIPQLSAIIECSDSAHGLNAHIISDGGITSAGDIVKAYGAGADFVMIGSLFAGHSECAGQIIHENNKQYKISYGMSSDTAMNKYTGQVYKYRTSEGRTVKVEFKGDIENTVLDILGGIRSACTYIGANCIKHIPRCTTFIKVNRQLNTLFEK